VRRVILQAENEVANVQAHSPADPPRVKHDPRQLMTGLIAIGVGTPALVKMVDLLMVASAPPQCRDASRVDQLRNIQWVAALQTDPYIREFSDRG
jgi:hypothetical protein